MSPHLISTNWSSVRRTIPAALACAYVLLLLPPWQFALPGIGLDPSWVEVIGYAARHGWQWGRDLVFTYGPLGYLLPNPYLEGGVAISLALNSFLAIALALGMVAVLPAHSPLVSIVLFVLVVFPAAMMGRVVYTVIGLLVVLRYFRQPDDQVRVQSLVMAAAAGLFALVYVSSGVFALAMFLLVDVSRLTHRRWPVFVPVFATSLVLCYLGAGQQANNLSTFLRGSFELISGYSGAMSVVGNRLELAAFVPLSAGALGIIAWCERSALLQRERRLDALLLIAGLGFHAFVAFKSGFVRHDLHSVNAWQALAIMLAGYAAVRWHRPGFSQVRWFLAAFSFATCTVSIFASEQGVQVSSVGKYASRVLLRQPALALTDAAQAATNPGAWNTAWLERRTDALSTIRAATPLPAVEGSVDVIPNIQSVLLARGMLYRPRPVFQDYAAYTPWLIGINRAYYRSPTAAEYILFGSATIDNRYPLLDQSSAVTELLTLYQPVGLEHGLLLLRRRSTPLPTDLSSVTETTASFAQWVPLEKGDAPVVLSAAISPTFLTRLAKVLFRPPMLLITVRLADGAEREFRLIEGMARSGFLLSPLVESPQHLAALATNRWSAVEQQRVVAFRIDTASQSGRRFYGESIRLTTTLLRIGTDATPEPSADMRTGSHAGS